MLPSPRSFGRRPALVAALAVWLVSCGSSGDSGSETPRVPPEGDAILFQQILDGTLPVDEGLVRIAHSGGFPIETSEGFLFAERDDQPGGPFSVEGIDGAFPLTPMTSWAGVIFAVIPVAAPDGAAYRLLRADGQQLRDRLSRRVYYYGSAERGLVRSSPPYLERWPGVSDPAGGVLGRTVRVWVQPTAPTHFLYVHDGQNLFNPRANFGGWRLQDAAGPATLVIGIDNTPDRFDEYTHVQDDYGSGAVGGNAPAYADYVQDVVRPFVESRYGTPVRAGVMGSSLGGLVAYYQALRNPGAYDFVASLSGTMGWGSIGSGQHQQTIIEAYAALGACPTGTLYLDSGGAGGACEDADADGVRDDFDGGDNYCENVQFRDVLETALGCTDVHYVWAQGAQHSESAWRLRAPAILDLFEAL